MLTGRRAAFPVAERAGPGAAFRLDKDRTASVQITARELIRRTEALSFRDQKGLGAAFFDLLALT